MKPILYLEGSSGISGDMTVAALLYNNPTSQFNISNNLIY